MNASRRLRDATRRLIVAHGALDRLERPCGTPLSMPHAYALLELLQEGAMTVSALAERLNIDRTNVSRLCLRLEEQGELLREPHPHDGRARLLRLTPQGERSARAVDLASVEHFERILSRLGEDAESIVEAVHLLTDALRPPPTSSREDIPA